LRKKFPFLAQACICCPATAQGNQTIRDFFDLSITLDVSVVIVLWKENTAFVSLEDHYRKNWYIFISLSSCTTFAFVLFILL